MLINMSVYQILSEVITSASVYIKISVVLNIRVDLKHLKPLDELLFNSKQN